MRFSLKKFSFPLTLSPSFNWLNRALASCSVRTRIIALALIPVAGFLAVGLTYISGESDVGNAFQTVKQSRGLADASRDFKIAVGAMRIAVKDFATQPHTLIDSFGRSQQLANKSLDQIEGSIGSEHADEIAALRQELAKLKKNFNQLVLEQRTLGNSESNGLRRELRDAANKIETAINENMTWLADAEAKKLMITLLTMRQHEAEYRLHPSELTRQQFLLPAIQRDVCEHRRHAGDEREAGAGGQRVRSDLRELDQGGRPHQSSPRIDRHRQPEHGAAR